MPPAKANRSISWSWVITDILKIDDKAQMILVCCKEPWKRKTRIMQATSKNWAEIIFGLQLLNAAQILKIDTGEKNDVWSST